MPTGSSPALRALALSRARPARPTLPRTAMAAVPTSAPFSTSARRQNEAPRSPFQTFVDVLKDELRKNRELQDNVKQLQGDVDKFQDSEAMKRAREAYERARVRYLIFFFLCLSTCCKYMLTFSFSRPAQLTTSIKENPRLRAAAEEMKKQGIKVGDAVGEALRTMEESEVMRAVRRLL
jgi:mitochondrial import inner membrane translocase subunit TIM44